MKISVVINTYNADRCLESVLKSVANYDEILICDMHSTDRTIEIAEKHGCKIIYHKKLAYADPARQYAISQAKYDWVFMIDADECIPKKLQQYLIDIVQADSTIAAVRFPLKNYFMGRFMHGHYPDRVTRFFKKDKVTWPARIHTRPTIDGKTHLIPSSRKDLAFFHNGVPSLSYKIYKMNIYTDIEVERRLERSNGYFALLLSPFTRFFRCYIMKGGFLDGIPGLIWAMDNAAYKFYAIAKAAETKVTLDQYDRDFFSHFGDDLVRTEQESKESK